MSAQEGQQNDAFGDRGDYPPVKRPFLDRGQDELIDIALRYWHEGDEWESPAWDAVTELRHRGTSEVFEKACELTESESTNERALGCDILGQLGVPERTFPADCTQHLLDLLEREQDPKVLSSIIHALWYLRSEEANHCAVIAEQFRQHWNSQVRKAVAMALMDIYCKQSIRILVELANDSDDDVREWATYALAWMEVGGPQEREIIEALRERLTDLRSEIREDAVDGLQRRDNEQQGV